MEAYAKLANARVSLKNSVRVCKEIKGKDVESAKRFLEMMINEKINLDGKYYTKICKTLLQLLNSAEANAKNKNMNVERLFIKEAKANKGVRFYRVGRIKRGIRRSKSTHLEIVLSEK